MRMRVLVGLVSIVALVGGACGGGGRTPQEIVFASATVTQEAKSSRMTMTIDMGTLTGDAGVGPVTAEGSFDYERQRGSLTMDLPLGEDQPTTQFEIVLIGTTMYQKFPPEMASFLGGKPWLKMDLAALSETSGLDLGALSSAQSADPTQALAQLRGVSDDVTEVGEEELRGDKVTHYRMTIDLDKAIAEAPEAQRKAMQAALEQLPQKTVPAEAWIDDDGRLRKLVQTMDVPDQGTVSLTMELYDFGVEVDVSEPPADQVIDFQQLLGQMPQQDGAPQQ